MSRGVKQEDRAEWERRGGRVRFDRKGRPVYVIRKQIGGQRFEVSTRRHTLGAALAEWERFEKDPEGYQPGGPQRAAAVYLDAKLSEEFLAWSEAPDGGGNTARWVGQQRLYLATWAEALRGVDLRRASLVEHILPPLKKATSRPQRIATLKRLYSWLRKVRHTLTPSEDPTLDTLSVPQNRPEQLRRPKAVPREHVQLAIEHLASDRWRDLLRVLAGSGMHVSELERFAADGTIEPLPRDGRAEGAAGVLVLPSTKSGEPLRVAVSEEVLAAAGRVLKAGPFDRQHFAKALASACDAVKRPDGGVGIPRFGAGQLRHSIATWAINAGADPATVAAFLGHKSPRTTKRFYAANATPAKVPTLL